MSARVHALASGPEGAEKVGKDEKCMEVGHVFRLAAPVTNVGRAIRRPSMTQNANIFEKPA